MRIPKAKKRPSGVWFIQLRLSGKSITVTAETEAKVQAKALAIKSGLEDARRPDPNKTLNQMIDAYIAARIKDLSPATVRGYRSIQRNRFQEYINRPASKVDWQEAVKVEKRQVSAKTVKNAWGLAKSALADNGIKPDITLKKVKKTPMPWLTPEQIPVFPEAIRDRPCELPALLGLCSLRRSEVFGLTWDDIDLAHNTITVHAATVMSEDGPTYKPTTKTESSARTVPIMIPRLAEVLNAIKNKTGPVCTCFIGTPYRQINAACRRVGLPEVGTHGLRRSFASLGYHLGLSELQIMEIGGWSDFGTVHKFYLYLSDLDKKDGTDKITSFFSDCL
ncbi:MAG: site-specific integrase [Oscillospiraceae bacterium]|nr:site-specific integrase [Oscillospiraceae bacterium]